MAFDSFNIFDKSWWSSLSKAQMATTITLMATIVIALVAFIIACVALAKANKKNHEDDVVCSKDDEGLSTAISENNKMDYRNEYFAKNNKTDTGLQESRLERGAENFIY